MENKVSNQSQNPDAFPPGSSTQDEETEMLELIHQARINLQSLVQKMRSAQDIDQRWVSIGTTDLQTGMMALSRAVEGSTKF